MWLDHSPIKPDVCVRAMPIYVVKSEIGAKAAIAGIWQGVQGTSPLPAGGSQPATAPKDCISAMKLGKLVLIGAVSSTVTGLLLARPATAKLMAMR